MPKPPPSPPGLISHSLASCTLTSGGIWFTAAGFGISFEAAHLLVVKQARGTKRKLSGLAAFNLAHLAAQAASDASDTPA